MKENPGLLQIYCGDGKGKTTAAVGAAVRAAGAGYRVYFLQFNKDGSSSELKILETLPQISVISGMPVSKFSWQMNERELAQTRSANTEKFLEALEAIKRDKIDVLVLDELCSAYEYDLIDCTQVLTGLRERPQNVEVIITGRNPAPELQELADYISEVVMRRHPYEKKIPARLGIEY